MSKGNRGADYTLLVFALAVFLFNSPLNIWWSSLSPPWYAIYIPWLAIVLFALWNQLRQDHGD